MICRSITVILFSRTNVVKIDMNYHYIAIKLKNMQIKSTCSMNFY